MSKIKELTAHLRRLIEKNYIVDYGIDNELNTVLNQIDIESELMQQRDIDDPLLSTKINYINQK